MISSLMEYKWWILLLSETTAWIATIYMGYARYWLRSNLRFIISTVIAVITGYVPHLTLAVMDYMRDGEIHLFGVVVLIIIILGLTIFKKYISRLDQWMKEWAYKKQQVSN